MTMNNKKVTVNNINNNNFKTVKVEFMTSSKLFTATMSSYYAAIHEMADKIKIFDKNIKSLDKIIQSLDPNSEDFQNEIALLEQSKAKRLEYKEESKKRILDCYSFLNNDLYDSYCSSESSFKKALVNWFDSQSIKASDSLITYMLKIVSYKSKTCRDGNVLAFKSKSQFNDSFMRGLAQLMLAKNALKPDLYKYESTTRLVKSVPKEKRLKKVLGSSDSNTININSIKNAYIEGEDCLEYKKGYELLEILNSLSTEQVSELKNKNHCRLDWDYDFCIETKKGFKL